MNTSVRLFNPEGERDWQKRRIIGGNTTRLIELNNIKYPWAVSLYRTMLQNFWIPEEVGLLQDRKDYERLPASERQAVNLTLSFLIFLDSIQTVNLPNIADSITAPEVGLCLTVQAFQEAVHSQSYAYILDTIADAPLRDMVYNYWRDDPWLMERNQLVTTLYEEFVNHPTAEALVRTVIANYALEGIYFYSGFAVFYALARQQKLMGVASIIRYIQRDEVTHLVLFQHIFREIAAENPDLMSPELVASGQAILRDAVEREIAWGQRVSAGQIPGITADTVDRFIRYLANQRFRAIGWAEPFPAVHETPYPWFEAFSQLNGQKTDFFEQRVLNYPKAGGVDWDSLD
jgi:ribonucleoside-diphosphate reductase beta chain